MSCVCLRLTAGFENWRELFSDWLTKILSKTVYEQASPLRFRPAELLYNLRRDRRCLQLP
jgi:hypothetical protein